MASYCYVVITTTITDYAKRNMESTSSDDQRSVRSGQMQHSAGNGWLERVLRTLSSPGVATVLKWVAISGVTVLVCGTVVYYIRSTCMLENLRRTIKSLRSTIQAMSKKIEDQNSFISTQQEAILTLLQTVESRFESQDRSTQELFMKNMEKVQHLSEVTMKGLKELSQQVQKSTGQVGLRLEGMAENQIVSLLVTALKKVIPPILASTFTPLKGLL